MAARYPDVDESSDLSSDWDISSESSYSTDSTESSSDEIISPILHITEEGDCYLNGSIVDNFAGHDFFNPGGRDDVPWCGVRRDSHQGSKKNHGKWLVFKDYDRLSATWSDVVLALKEGRLEGCVLARVSTLFYNPTSAGPGPSTHGVICVHTSDDNIDDIGDKLIEIVKQDIKYKTNEDSRNYKYAHVGAVSTIKTLYYNQGHPSTQLIGERCFGTTQNKEDIWHINEVVNTIMSEAVEDYGRWILPLEYEELTDLWHLLKRMIEDDELEVLRMVCPPKQKKENNGKPVFYIYTGEHNVYDVGSVLISEVCRNIKFERKNGYPRYKILFWNEGDYSYEMVTRKEITKNWRTGEDM